MRSSWNGDRSKPSSGSGTVFKLNQNGSGYAVLRSFSLVTGGDGDEPEAPVIEGSDGVLYGTAEFGGSNGFGTIFSLNKDGSGYKILRSFSTENSTPFLLLAGTDGALYGATRYGGATVFKLSTDGNDDAVLHQFTGGDGGGGVAALVAGRHGVLYGMTLSGGTNECTGFGCTGGTVFKLDRDGSNFTVLHHFQEGLGVFGSAGLVEGSDGSVYGTTHDGGASGYGTVFKLNPDGSGYTVLRSFTGNDGFGPVGLIQASDGALYGTTSRGGDMDFGTVFKLFASTPIIAITRIELDGTGALLSLSGGAADQTWHIQATSNLDTSFWHVIATNQFGIDGKFQFLDTSTSNYPTRFYRNATP